MSRAYFKVFNTYLQSIEPLNDRERGRLFTALLEYSITGKVPVLKGNERFVFPTLKVHMDLDIESYDTKAEDKRRAGSKGGKRTQDKRRELSGETLTSADRETDSRGNEQSEDGGDDDNDDVSGKVSYDVSYDVSNHFSKVNCVSDLVSDPVSDRMSKEDGVSDHVSYHVSDDVCYDVCYDTDVSGGHVNGAGNTVPHYTTGGDAHATEDSTAEAEADSSETNSPKRKRKKFVPPTVDEVRAYCKERGNNVDPRTFVEHYAANGWMRGRTPMADWKASVRLWETKEQYGTRGSTATPLESSFDTDDFFNAALERVQRETQELGCG